MESTEGLQRGSEDDPIAEGLESRKPRRCIIHVVDKEKSQVKPFDEKLWENVKRAAASRKSKKMFNKSKYKTAIDSMPEHPSPEHGYHSKCYKSFVAIQWTDVKDPEREPTGVTLRSSSPQPSTSRLGILPKECIYCGKTRKTTKNGLKEGLMPVTLQSAADNILEAANILQDSKLLSKLSGIDLISKEAMFHNSCRARSLSAAQRIKGKQTQAKFPEKESKAPLNHLYDYGDRYVIGENRPEQLCSILDRYEMICLDLGESSNVSSTSYLAKLLKTRFPSTLHVTSPKAKKQGMIAHNSLLDYESIKTVFDFKSSPEGQVMSVAIMLRKMLKDVEKKSLEDPLQPDSLIEGEGKAPNLVNQFFRILYGGTKPSGNNEAINRRVQSACEDALFNVSNGNIKTSKHIVLGMLVKSITGSKKLVTVLNRLGHCESYTILEELETRLAEAVIERRQSCPDGVKAGLPIALAFDNYDELVHTLSGANTLHDTMGILYQGISEVPTVSEEEIPTSSGLQVKPPARSKIRYKRKLNIDNSDDTLPFVKKPRMGRFSYKQTNFLQLQDKSARAKKLYDVFLFGHTMRVDLPMWVGFNGRHFVDKLSKQAVYYMPNMNKPITRLDVVAETMRTTMKCALEVGQKYGIVTYDLDVAKVAQKIQATDLMSQNPEFGNLFIMLGVFHIFICVFRAIGKVIAESGGPEMLVDSGVLASGSLRGFLECFAYNRCKRLHPLLALAIEILHFRKFLNGYENQDLVTLVTATDFSESGDIQRVIDSAAFQELSDAYQKFTEKTENGELGETAQFWMMYCKYIRLYLLLQRSVRENDLELFTFGLTPIIDLCFATNRTFYSRWLTKYQLDLMNIDDSHPGLRCLLESGGFSVRRTENHFSRIPVDLTLEQTINADAASRLTGISSSTNNYSSRLRWSVTKGARAQIARAAYDMVGLGQEQDGIAESTDWRIQKDNEDLQKIINQIEASINPFELDRDQALLNISTGRIASPEVRESLLSIAQEGRDRHEKFVEGCVEDADRFEKPIKRNPLKTFANDCISNKKAPATSKVAQLKCTSQLLGRIAFTAANNEIDLEYVFSFPLTPVPLSMCRSDGTLLHTDKSRLWGILEKSVEDHGSPSDPFAIIIDGNFLLHTMSSDQPSTYGALSRNVLLAVLRYPAKRVDIIFDTYERPWIKDAERERRGANVAFHKLTISGPEQRCGRTFKKLLENESFKREFPIFLLKDWANNHYAHILEDREVYLGVQEKCVRFHVNENAVESEDVTALFCNHPEADTRIVLHMLHADSECRELVVRGSDTDILVILLYHSAKVKSTVWMECGTSGQGNRRHVNVSKVAETIGPKMCAALPGLHSFTGCDYTAAFARKGKERPFNIAKSNENFLQAFASLAQLATPETQKNLERFVCSLYGCKKDYTLNQLRYKTVEKVFLKSTRSEKPFEKLKNIEGSSIPPCDRELKPHIDRCNFVTMIWANANENYIRKDICGRGWDENTYHHIWFEGEQLPPSLVPQIRTESDDREEDSDEDENNEMDQTDDDSD